MEDQTDGQLRVIRVSKTSKVASVAGSIAGFVRSEGQVAVQSIGLEASGRAVKALTLATEYLRLEGRDIVFRSEFMDVRCREGEDHLRGFRFVVLTAPGKV